MQPNQLYFPCLLPRPPSSGREVLILQGLKLNYANHMIMGDNVIAPYNAKGSTKKVEAGYKKRLPEIVKDIQFKKNMPAKPGSCTVHS